MALCMGKNPNITEEELEQRMRFNYETSPENLTHLRELIDEDILANCMLRQDFLEARDWTVAEGKQVVKSHQEKEKLPQKVKNFVSRATPVLGESEAEGFIELVPTPREEAGTFRRVLPSHLGGVPPLLCKPAILETLWTSEILRELPPD